MFLTGLCVNTFKNLLVHLLVNSVRACPSNKITRGYLRPPIKFLRRHADRAVFVLPSTFWFQSPSSPQPKKGNR